YVPSLSYVCFGFASVLLVPSPRSHAYVYGGHPPTGEPLNCTSSGSDPLAGSADPAAETRGQLWPKMNAQASRPSPVSLGRWSWSAPVPTMSLSPVKLVNTWVR